MRRQGAPPSWRRSGASIWTGSLRQCPRKFSPTTTPAAPSSWWGGRRAPLGKEGTCDPCRRQQQLETIEARIAELLPRLTAEERRTYERTECGRESRADPMPQAPDTSGMSRYAADKAAEAHDEAMERWLCRYLYRRVKAGQKRKERIEKKVPKS